MADVVVTVPKRLWEEWLAEGDLPGEQWSGDYSDFWVGGVPVKLCVGERVYVVCNQKLRGYSPLYCLYKEGKRCALVRRGGAVACTVDEEIKGFRGFRYRWWDRNDEKSFEDWRTL